METAVPGQVEIRWKIGLWVGRVAILDKVREKIQDIPLTKGKVFQDKLSQVLEKNSNLKIFINMTKIHSRESANMPSGWSPNDVSEQMYCQVTSVDLERSFSVYKHIFSDKRHSFIEENLEKVVVANCSFDRVHGK